MSVFFSERSIVRDCDVSDKSTTLFFSFERASFNCWISDSYASTSTGIAAFSKPDTYSSNSFKSAVFSVIASFSRLICSSLRRRSFSLIWRIVSLSEISESLRWISCCCLFNDCSKESNFFSLSFIALVLALTEAILFSKLSFLSLKDCSFCLKNFSDSRYCFS